ncbi:MAG: hypothetical protein L0Z62_36755 [Gemmataceae bacterium]|nr:hypothetical protein [Gemmataceae bacterium]
MIATYPKALLGLLVAGAGLFVTPQGAQAQSPQHIHRLALRLEKQAREVHREVHAHFRRTPQFRHLDRDVAGLERLAGHIHEVAHRGSLAHLRADVRKMDRLFHHIEELVEEMRDHRELDRRAYAHLRSELRDLGRTLHHLSDDLNRVAGRDRP